MWDGYNAAHFKLTRTALHDEFSQSQNRSRT